MTALALRVSSRSNGVSRLHGEVTRRMWEPLLAERGANGQQPLTTITNGVHVATWVAAVSQAAEVYRARLYAIDSHVSSIATAERKIYRGASGEQTYLALFECAAPAPWETDDWRAVEQSLPPEAHPAASFASIERESYWLEAALYPAEAGA